MMLMHIPVNLRPAYFAAIAGALSFLRAQGGTLVRVTGDAVNLRAGPSINAEAVAKAHRGDILIGGAMDGDWMEVLPPEHVDFYVHSELVKDGVIVAPKAMVRAGPGISYRAVGKVQEGERVTVRGTWGEWLKIQPPPGAMLWINRQYVEPLESSPSSPAKALTSETNVVVAAPIPASTPTVGFATQAGRSVSPTGIPRTVSAPSAYRPIVPTSGATVRRETHVASPLSTVPSIPRELLVASKPQGMPVAASGVIRQAGFVWRRPSKFCLVAPDSRGRVVMGYYVLAPECQLSSLVGRRVTIHGRQYWVQGVRHPVLQAERLVKNN